MNADEPNSNPNSKKLIFFSKQRAKKINRKLDIYLFHEISCSFKVSTPIS